jgi:AAA15 family ATPase/GTPase
MLTRIQIRNFKKLKNTDIELGKSVVLVGPNNSGKSAALQALALWDIGLRQWTSKRGTKASPAKRPGVAINRKDLISIPVPKAKLLWSDLHVREVDNSSSKPKTKNLLRKTNYHILAGLVSKDKIDKEIIVKLDAIVEVANKAKPRS